MTKSKANCRHHISDCACKVSPNLVPDEDCEHCPIPKLENAWKKLKSEAASNGDVPFCRGWLQMKIKAIEEGE